MKIFLPAGKQSEQNTTAAKAEEVYLEYPAEIKNKPLPEFLSAIYSSLSQIPMEGAIETGEAAAAKV